MFISTWLVIRILLTKDSPPGGWVLKFLADSTSALGWDPEHSSYLCSSTHASCPFDLCCCYISHSRSRQHRHRRPFPAGLVPHVDIDRSHQPGASTSDGLSDSYRSAIAPALARLKSADRGLTRKRNERTALAQALHFVCWGWKRGFADFAFQHTSQTETGEVLAAYAQEIAEGTDI